MSAGFLYGACLPKSKPYAPPYFVDQDWKKPDRDGYMKALALWRPEMCTVLDWEREEQFCEVMDWSGEAAQYVNRVLIIPKVPDTVHRIPRFIGSAQVVIGYSVPTKHGATCVPIWELEGRDVHLLGGSPQRQMQEYHAIQGFANVYSVDGNMAQKMATGRCCFWRAESFGREGHWKHLVEGITQDAPYEAFRRSCANIAAAWARIGKG